MTDSADRIESTFRRFRDLAGGDNLAAAALVLAHALSDESAGDECQMLSVRAVAERLGVSQRTVRNLIDRGKLPASKIGIGRGVPRVDPADLKRFQKQSAGANWRG
jgi:excisionase family DNA binding protein